LKAIKPIAPRRAELTENEVLAIRQKIEEKTSSLNLPVKIHLFLLPLQEKSVLIQKLDEQLKRVQ